MHKEELEGYLNSAKSEAISAHAYYIGRIKPFTSCYQCCKL